MPAILSRHIDFFQDISKEGDLILMSQFLIHGENGVSNSFGYLAFNDVLNVRLNLYWAAFSFMLNIIDVNYTK